MMLGSDLGLKLTSDYEVANLAISYWCYITVQAKVFLILLQVINLQTVGQISCDEGTYIENGVENS